MKYLILSASLHPDNSEHLPRVYYVTGSVLSHVLGIISFTLMKPNEIHTIIVPL